MYGNSAIHSLLIKEKELMQHWKNNFVVLFKTLLQTQNVEAVIDAVYKLPTDKMIQMGIHSLYLLQLL